MGIFDKFKIGFKKSASAFTSGLKEIIVKKEINDENLNRIEEFLTGKLSISIDENDSIHMKGPVSEIEEINIKL